MDILFVCSGNTCRSAMAEGMLRAMLKERGMEGFRVRSAGIAAFSGEKASPQAVRVMGELGIDLSGHRARRLDTGMLKEADQILAMTGGNKIAVQSWEPSVWEKLHTLKEYAGMDGGDIQDPYGRSEDIYRRTRDEIRLALEKLMAKWGPASG